MDKKIIIGVLVFALIASIVGLLIPAEKQPAVQTFPWQIELTPEGKTKVFGLTLGQSTLQQAEQVFGAISELSLFYPVPGQGQRGVEAYFDKVNLGGLSARVVAVMSFTPEQLQSMHDRGARISTLGDGSRKVTLHTDDVRLVRNTSIYSITYLPRIRLEKELLEKRFGKPDQLVAEQNTNTQHWMYPELGLDIALDENSYAVFQYIAPSQFEALLEPLK